MSLLDFCTEGIVDRARALGKELAALPDRERMRVLNHVRKVLHEVSPMRAEPVDCVLWVPADEVRGNDYNPNTVAPPEMRLLERSIREDGFTQPIVAFKDGNTYEVVDGFHRNRVGKECPAVRARVQGFLPVTVINQGRTDIKDRMAATIRHNRARGVHGVIPMVDIVAGMLRAGMTDDEVAAELGMDADEVLRFKQCSGLPELFKDHEYSQSWE